VSSIYHRRPDITPAEIQASELEWWQEFAELEQRFAWVQTPAMQRILRGRYVREIVTVAGRAGRILELGCGVGWLSLVLAKSGASEVSGMDSSPAQIALARDCAKAAGLSDRVHFHCVDGTQDGISTECFDCVVVHGFLHHLNSTEVGRTIARVPRLLKPSGAFIVFEPVRHERESEQETSKWLKWQRKLAELANRGRRFGVRRISHEEQRWRDLFVHRNWGLPPHGPSPKEIPFSPGELEGYLNPHFIIERQVVCMVHSHLVIQEWLLRELSHPRFTRLLLPWVARAAAWLDRGLVAEARPPSGCWLFCMFVCRPRASNG
jgi:SAM-dependent methyltransferase